jgi:hypothetical protein
MLRSIDKANDAQPPASIADVDASTYTRLLGRRKDIRPCQREASPLR